MKNDQPHALERKYVGVKVRKCSEKLDGPCKPDKDITELLNSLVFTFYLATGVAQLGERSNYGKNPIKPVDNYFQQFQLSLDSYRDNNVLVRTNHIYTHDSRYNIFQNYKHFNYMDVYQGPVWIGRPYHSKTNVEYTRDGKTVLVLEES